MESRDKLLRILRSEEFRQDAGYIFINYAENLNSKVNTEQFTTFLKAFILDMYNAKDSEEKKEKFVKRMEHARLEEYEIEYLILKLNTCLSKPNDHIDKESVEFFEELEVYKSDNLCRVLSKYKDATFRMIADDLGGIFTIKQIKDGDYYIVHRGENRRIDEFGYTLAEDEIKALEDAHKASALVDIGHSLYDDFTYIPHEILGKKSYERLINCDYVKADEDGLGSMVFHTGKDTPQYKTDIVFEDGIIMSYHRGDIRKNPYTLDELLSFVYADTARELRDDGVNDISSMNPEDLKQMLLYSGLEVFSQLESFSKIYSKKMIDDAKVYVKKLGKIVEEENL